MSKKPGQDIKSYLLAIDDGEDRYMVFHENLWWYVAAFMDECFLLVNPHTFDGESIYTPQDTNLEAVMPYTVPVTIKKIY